MAVDRIPLRRRLQRIGKVLRDDGPGKVFAVRGATPFLEGGAEFVIGKNASERRAKGFRIPVGNKRQAGFLEWRSGRGAVIADDRHPAGNSGERAAAARIKGTPDAKHRVGAGKRAG